MRIHEFEPGLPANSGHDIARRAVIIFEEACFEDGCIREALFRLGVTQAELDRGFEEGFDLSAVDYIQNRSSFFQEKALSPAIGGRVTLYLRYSPPYRWDWIYRFLSDRAIPGVESALDGEYRRTALFRRGEAEYTGWISVGDDPSNSRLKLTVSSSLLPVIPRVISRVRGLFDTDCDPARIYEKLSLMNELREGLCEPGARTPGCFDPFETAVRTVLGQQITVKAARTLATRIVDSFGGYIDSPVEGLERAFPGPGTFLGMRDSIEDRLGTLGVTGARSRSIRAIAESVATGSILLSRSACFAEEEKKLLALPGVGPWTAHCLGMRVFGLPDAFPHTDFGVKKALDGMTNKEILALGESWRPWRSYAVINLWNYDPSQVSPQAGIRRQKEGRHPQQERCRHLQTPTSSTAR